MSIGEFSYRVTISERGFPKEFQSIFFRALHIFSSGEISGKEKNSIIKIYDEFLQSIDEKNLREELENLKKYI